MSSFRNPSTVIPLAFANSLIALAVLNLTVNEYQPFSGMNKDEIHVYKLTGQS